MQVKIDKLVFGGQGLAKLDNGKAVFVWNALPGETVEIEMIKRKKDYEQAVAVEIIEASTERIEPKEELYLSSSPWQIMTPEAENQYKIDIATEIYGKNGGMILGSNKPEIFSNNQDFGYRNKIEFSFAELENGKKSLAFFERGKKFRKPVDGSLLAEPVINQTAKYILSWVNEKEIPMRSLKSLIIRSNGAGKSIAALFIKDQLEFDSFPELSDDMLGFQLYYSTHKSPASVPTKLMYSAGQDYLEAKILGTKLKFGLLSFFQINIPVFEEALRDIAAFVGPKTPLIDYYSGVGAISLPLAKNREQTFLVDSNQEAIEYAKENISENNLKNCLTKCMPAEKLLDIIDSDKTIILDPPRAGLHDKVVLRLLSKQPKKILYLSCNLSTQARDIAKLSEFYKPVFIKLYNFFPRTPHVEGLVVLEKI